MPLTCHKKLRTELGQHIFQKKNGKDAAAIYSIVQFQYPALPVADTTGDGKTQPRSRNATLSDSQKRLMIKTGFLLERLTFINLGRKGHALRRLRWPTIGE